MPDLRHVLGPGWRHLDGWTFGEFDVLNFLLSAGASRAPAGRAAAGWGGGRLEIYGPTRQGSDDAVVIIELAWDKEADLREFRMLLETLFTLQNGVSSGEPGRFGWTTLSHEAFTVWKSGTEVQLVFASDESALQRIRAHLLR